MLERDRLRRVLIRLSDPQTRIFQLFLDRLNFQIQCRVGLPLFGNFATGMNDRAVISPIEKLPDLDVIHPQQFTGKIHSDLPGQRQ